MKNGKDEKAIQPAVAVGPPQLTEFERLKMENFALRNQVLQTQLQQLFADRTAYLETLKTNHPGCVWDEQRGLVVADTVGKEPAAAETPLQ